MFTSFYIMGWPFWGRDVGEQESQELAELCAGMLRQALPDYADFIKVGDKQNQGDGRILHVIKQVFDANYKDWIKDFKFVKPLKPKESKRVEIRELGKVLPVEKKPGKNVNLRG